MGPRLIGGEALLALEHFDHIDHVVRIVIEAGEVFSAQLVRLRFLTTAVFRDIAGSHPLRGLRCRVGGAPEALAFEHDAKDGRRHHAEARRLLAGGALRAVPRGHVADLVADDTREVGFAVHIGHDAACDIHVTAGQREGIDVRAVEHGEVPVKLGAVRGLGQPLADFVDVGLQLGIVVFAKFREDLGVRFRTFGHLAALVHNRALELAGNRVFDGGTTRKEQRGRETNSNQKSVHGRSP